jgi:hypothetical protein
MVSPKHIYSSPEVHQKLRIAAAKAKKPMSEYLGDLLEEHDDRQ